MACHRDLDLEVFFCHDATPEEQSAAGFGVPFTWDIPVLNGYRYRFLKNVSSRPSVHGFSGLDTPEVRPIISREGFDAVIINGWHYKSAWQAMRGCWKTNTPVMVRSDSHLREGRSLRKTIIKWPYYRWFIQKLDACLAVGTWSRDYFLNYGAKPERIFSVPHVVDEDFFHRQSDRLVPERQALRAKWQIREDAVVFVFAGKFIEKKRPLDFIRAIEKARDNGRPLAGLMVGDGPLRGHCENFVKSRHLPVSFTGFLNQSEIVKAYVAADALVLPSDGRETWGLVVNEAMACGLPCIASDHVGCAPDMIVEGETGAVFPMGNCERLGEVLSMYADNPEKLREMGVRAKRKAQEYGVSAAVDGVLQAVESVNK